jgi:hypothetical protein
MQSRAIQGIDAQIEKAEARLAELKARRKLEVAVQKTWLQHLFYAKLARVLRPVFAMGPAWVLMRALAVPYPVTEEFATKHGEDAVMPLVHLEDDLMYSRVDPRSLIVRTLQGLAGDALLESELFVAIYQVCKGHSERAEAKIRGRGVSNKEFADDPADRPERLRNLNGSPKEAE